MPRGESQEVPQEEKREQSEEIRELPQEVQRDQEVVAEPEAVVERERPVAESEAIEAAVVEAVEAVDAAETAADAGPTKVDRAAIAQPGEEGSATPIPLPTDPPGEIGQEVSATPIPLPTDPPGELGDEVSATPIPLPTDPPGELGDEVSATPIPLPTDPPGEVSDPGSIEISPAMDEEPPKPPQGRREDGGSGTEVVEEVVEGLDETSFKVESGAGTEQVILDDTSFKVETPQADRASGGVEEEILDPDAFKPIPAHEDRQQSPTKPVVEKELPEGGQREEGYQQQEDLQDLADGDLGALMPDGGEILGPDGKKFGGSKFGDELGGIPGMDSGGKIDGSSEDPSGDQFAGKGMFKPGKGPGGGGMESDVPGARDSSTWTNDERDAYVSAKAGVPEKDMAAKEKSAQEKALDDYEITQAILSTDEAEEEKLRKKYGGSNSEPSTMESTPDGEEGGGSDVKAVTQQELDTVLDETSGDQISQKDPDDQSGGEPDGHLKPEAAKKIKDAMDMAGSAKHKQKKAGSEVITDPDQEDQDQKGDRLGKKLGL